MPTRTLTTPAMHRTVDARRRAGSPRTAAFSLMEILIALGIFAVGLVAVASIFPTAIAIQSDTVRTLAGQRIADDARSTVMDMARSKDPNPLSNFRTFTYAKKVDTRLPIGSTARNNSIIHEGTLADFADSRAPASGRTGFAGRVQPMIDLPYPLPTASPSLEIPPNAATLNAAKSFHALFTMDVRSYPKTIADPTRRDYYWYPLIKQNHTQEPIPAWRMYLMIMHRQGTDAVPEVRAARLDLNNTAGATITLASSGGFPGYIWDNDRDDDDLPDLIQPGDLILTDVGTVHRVVLTDGKRVLNVANPLPDDPNNYTNLKPAFIYFAVAIDRATGAVKRESRSPIVRIEQFDLAVQQP